MTSGRQQRGGKAPPHDLDAERSVLGSCLLEPDAVDRVADILGPGDWYSDAHRTVWELLVEMRSKGAAIDLTTVRSELVDRGALARAGGDEGLLALQDRIPAVSHVEDHARRIRDRAMVRRMMLACQEVAAEGYDASPDPQGYLDRAEAKLLAASQDRHVEGGPVLVREAIETTFREIQAAAQRGERLVGLSTGLRDLDRKTNGLEPGEHWIVAARPGMGKSGLGLDIAAAVAAAGEPTLFASLEMSRKQLVQRLLARGARVDISRLRTASIARDDWPRLTEAASEIAGWPLHLDEEASLKMLQLRSRARRIKSRHALSLVVVDYLQLMKSGTKQDSREQEVAEISRGLKSLAKELEIPVVSLAQINRESESRGKNKRPLLSDLRESGSLEQDADVVTFIYRDEMYHEDTANRGIAELIIAKQREGPTGTVRTRYFPEYSRFEDLADDDVPADPDPSDYVDDPWGKDVYAD